MSCNGACTPLAGKATVTKFISCAGKSHKESVIQNNVILGFSSCVYTTAIIQYTGSPLKNGHVKPQDSPLTAIYPYTLYL